MELDYSRIGIMYTNPRSLEMRKIEYLSPTSINLYYSDPKEFYMRYLSVNKPPRPLQTRPMSVGSAFDSYVKSWLHERLFGKGNDPKFDLDNLFEAQVQVQNRDSAREAGKFIFEEYQKSGALTDLLLELQQSIGKPRFEIDLMGAVKGHREGVTQSISGVVFFGKPDLFFINKIGTPIILDFKVNGFYGRYNTQPMQGYLKLRDPATKVLGNHHRNCVPYIHRGTLINCATYLETLNNQWALQLSIYAWLLGCNVGEDYIASIDQIICNGTERDVFDRPKIRVAEHRLRVHTDYQYVIFAKTQNLWDLTHSDHFFRDLSKEESQQQCLLLDEIAKGLCDPPEDDNDRWFRSIM